MLPRGMFPPHFNPWRQERNALELLTVAAIESIPSTVLFVTDSSGTSQPLPTQLKVRAEMRRLFEKRFGSHSNEFSVARAAGWIDVLSKTDLRPVGANSPGGLNTNMFDDEADEDFSRTWIDRAVAGR